MSKSAQQSGRRIFLINPKFQLSFLTQTVGVATILIASFYLADVYFFWRFTQLGQGLGLPSDHVFFQFIQEQRATKNFYYAVTAGAAMVGLSVWGILFSHRIAGPMYRMRKHLTAVAEGETAANVRFREGDYFQEVAEAYNLQMEQYRAAVKNQNTEGTEDFDDSMAA